MKPNGILFAIEKIDNKFEVNLKLAGFSNIKSELAENSFSVQKPNFEVGSSAKLSFAQPAVWALGSNDLVDEQVELINEDDLLDESDLIKPAAESLRGKKYFLLFLSLLSLLYVIFPSLWNNGEKESM